MRRHVVALLTGWVSGWGLAAIGAETAESPLAMPELQTVFQESFATHPTDRFEFLGPVSFESSPGCLTLHSPDGRNMSVAHWAITGPVAQLKVKLGFPPIAKEGGRAETRVGFVVGVGEQVLVAFSRERKMGKVTGRIRLVHCAKRPGFPPDGKVLKTYPPGDFHGGVWVLDYHYGYLRVAHEDALVAQAFAELPVSTSAVMGLILNQRAGSVSFHAVQLAGSKLVRPPSEADQHVLAEAADAAKKLAPAYRHGDFVMAFQHAMDAMIRYRRVWGEDHPDTAIAYSNLAIVVLARGDSESARKTFEQALAIQRKVLGTRHPLTAMTHARLGMLLAERGEQARARPQLKRALAVLADVLTPDHPLLLSIRKSLDMPK